MVLVRQIKLECGPGNSPRESQQEWLLSSETIIDNTVSEPMFRTRWNPRMRKQRAQWTSPALQKIHWSSDAGFVHHSPFGTDTLRRIGPANNAETVLIRCTSDTRETKTASSIPQPVRTTVNSSLIVRVARQATTDNKGITPTEWVTVCMAEPEIANPTNDEADIHEMLDDQAGKRALNNYDLIRHPQNSALA